MDGIRIISLLGIDLIMFIIKQTACEDEFYLVSNGAFF